MLGYYSPGESWFAEVSADGTTDETSEDSKRVSKSLTIKAEISLAHLITTGIKFRLSKYDFNNTPDKATGDSGAASATGKEGHACAIGIDGKAKGAKGCFITLAEWLQDDQHVWHRRDVCSVAVDGKKIKADTFYQLKTGKFFVVDDQS